MPQGVIEIAYRMLDVFFLVFHTIFTVFNVVGWISRKTRKIHLFTMLATAFSWFILGIWYGWGYCFCTDWHWCVREKLGAPIHHASYIQFLIDEIVGVVPDQEVTDAAVVSIYLVCLTLTVYLNIRDRKNAYSYKRP